MKRTTCDCRHCLSSLSQSASVVATWEQHVLMLLIAVDVHHFLYALVSNPMDEDEPLPNLKKTKDVSCSASASGISVPTKEEYYTRA